MINVWPFFYIFKELSNWFKFSRLLSLVSLIEIHFNELFLNNYITVEPVIENATVSNNRSRFLVSRWIIMIIQRLHIKTILFTVSKIKNNLLTGVYNKYSIRIFVLIYIPTKENKSLWTFIVNYLFMLVTCPLFEFTK